MPNKDFRSHVTDIVRILDGMDRSGFDHAENYRITLVGGTTLFASSVTHVPLDSDDHLVTVMTPTNARLHDRSTLLASEIQMVTRIDLHGISPGAADEVHADVALKVVDAIMDSEDGHDDLLNGIRTLAAKRIAERSEAFLAMTRRHLEEMRHSDPHCEFIPLLQSLLKGCNDGEEIRAVVTMLAVDLAHRVSKVAYEPFMTETAWKNKTLQSMGKALQLIDLSQDQLHEAMTV